MLTSVVVDYTAARVIFASDRPRFRRLVLGAAVSTNLSLLGFFKYYYFVDANIIGLGSLMGIDLSLPAIHILLPIGISFYTFQSISYSVDVYRGFIKPVRDFVLFADYVMFFPQLIAGPILRAKEVVWQLDVRPRFDLADFAAGIRRILGGLFLKVVLADNLASVVDEVYLLDPAYLGPIDTLTMAFLFGFQIYFDFAGYSHIALGSAQLLGIRFPENFRFPYLATSPRHFWRRWHITLSSWIRDYVYLPLAGGKVEDRSTGGLGARSTEGAQRHLVFALFVTWALMGLWHGAGWAFILWGLWHAVLVQAYRSTARLRARLPNPMRVVGGWAITLPLVMLAWIPFRTQSIETTFVLWGHLLRTEGWLSLGMRENVYLIALVVMGIVLAAPLARECFNWLASRRPFCAAVVETVGITAAAALTFVYLRPVEQFIYFQF
jgi:D-alanyl-lipoteichoic acid acyltransferase DltB (MBOAT superfamily)